MPSSRHLQLFLLFFAIGGQLTLLTAGDDPQDLLHEHILSQYFTNAEIAAYLRSLQKRFSSIVQVTSIGKSALGADVLAVEISNNPGHEEAKPYFKYVGNIHGDEPSGRQLLLQLAEHLCSSYEQDSAVTKIVRDMHIFIVPTMNPDGFDTRSRNNGLNVDLNRNFPDPQAAPQSSLRCPTHQQAEALNIMNLTLLHRFVGSLSLHEGALVANYPWDGYSDMTLATLGMMHDTPDGQTFRMLAHLYANLHNKMNQSTEFEGGITNGARWYPLYGGMQDWNYVAGGCMELTLELSPQKWPMPEELPGLWLDNMRALLNWPLEVMTSVVYGSVLSDVDGQPLGGAIVSVEGINHPVLTGPLGNYYRILVPGNYTFMASFDGFDTRTGPVTLSAGAGPFQLDFRLPHTPGAAATSAATLAAAAAVQCPWYGEVMQQRLELAQESMPRPPPSSPLLPPRNDTLGPAKVAGSQSSEPATGPVGPGALLPGNVSQGGADAPADPDVADRSGWFGTRGTRSGWSHLISRRNSVMASEGEADWPPAARDRTIPRKAGKRRRTGSGPFWHDTSTMVVLGNAFVLFTLIGLFLMDRGDDGEDNMARGKDGVGAGAGAATSGSATADVEMAVQGGTAAVATGGVVSSAAAPAVQRRPARQ